MLVGCLRGILAVRSSKIKADCFPRRPLLAQDSLFLPQRRADVDSRNSEFICTAKKAKKKTQTSDFAVRERVAEPWAEVDAIMLLLLLVESYSRRTGKPLMEDADISNIANDVFKAPFCLLAHDYTGQESVKYSYANEAALNMLCATWDEVVGHPSTLFEKETLESVSKEGHLSGLSVNVSASDGSQLELQEVNLVNITSPSDELVGQMILFEKWLLEDGTEVGPGHVPASQIPSEDEMGDAQMSVDTLAAKIRDMKENQGLKNSAAAVKDAVAELLQAKENLARLEMLTKAAIEQVNENKPTD